MTTVSVQTPLAEDGLASFVDGTFTSSTNDASSAVAQAMSPACGKRSEFDLFRLDGRVAVITGGARGLGYSMTEGLCAAGDLGERACEQLHCDYGVSARFYRLDVRDEVAVQDAMNFAIHDFGRIDIPILSAGVGRRLLPRKAVGSMSASIVNWPNPQSDYSASKAGVIHLMKSLSAKWSQHRIRCNSISPGYMDTPLNTIYEETYFHEWKARTPMGR
ncbi:hypothetical protein V1508DRAFT_457777 [Lipomyces doorenjongii]|uniref:uncharacterized protein n=1 Tax=Lipomyces doorenjongii TaxID=383834 RepID=UPI0034CDCA0D